MSPETHQRVRKLFDEALERPENERLAFLKSACDGDDEAYQTAVRLLEAYQPAQSFLEDRPRGIERIGRYLITGELGRGSMGVVYEAIDPIIGRNVAVKVIHMEALADQGQAQFLRERLFREARSAGQLFHPGIVTVLDVGQEGELAFIAMERVDGLSLQRTLASLQGSGPGAVRKLEREQILDILRQTAAALDFAHRNKVVHCDVKPGNIILGRNDSSGGVVKLTDFGIAKIASTQYHTRTGLLMGTPSYMSPEQIEAHPVDGRSDQFSLAVVAFELLTGAVPFRGESLAGLAHSIVYGATPSARAADPELPEGVDAILERALAKSPGDRFPSCTEFVRDLEKSWSAAAQRPTVPVAASIPTGAPRGKMWGLAIAGALVLALAAAAVYRFTIHSAPVSPTPAALSLDVPPQGAPPPLAAPVVARFTADPASVKAGALVTLRWEVKGAVKVIIDPDAGVVESSGTVKVKPRATTVYKLEATGPGGQMTMQEARVTVADGVSATTLYAEAVAERRAGHPERAFPLFRQAAEMGDTRAMLELGNLSADGEGVERNYAEATRWFHMAAERGSSTSMLLLGGMYYLGNGVPQDFASAAHWFERAADSGEPDAKYDLGMMYERGLGVAKDLDKAKQLYQDAAKLGNEEARKRLADLGVNH